VNSENGFWNFIEEGGYEIRENSVGKPKLYRFDKPTSNDFPKMLELFSRDEYLLGEHAGLTPIHIDETVSSLSAILLDENYYEVLLRERLTSEGVSVLSPSGVMLFKIKAWLDLNEAKNRERKSIQGASKNIEMMSYVSRRNCRNAASKVSP